MLYLGRGSSVTQCPLCKAFTLPRIIPRALQSVRILGGVKIVDTFALHALPPYSAAGHKALIAQSNLVLTGV